MVHSAQILFSEKREIYERKQGLSTLSCCHCRCSWVSMGIGSGLARYRSQGDPTDRESGRSPDRSAWSSRNSPSLDRAWHAKHLRQRRSRAVLFCRGAFRFTNVYTRTTHPDPPQLAPCL